jgi:hypothetical protein
LDRERTRVADWLELGNSHLSYLVCLEANESNPQMPLSADRNLMGGTPTDEFIHLVRSNSLVSWTTNIHAGGGNVALSDGSAQLMSDGQLRQQLRSVTNEFLRLAIP